MEYVELAPVYQAQRTVKRGRGESSLRGRHLTFPPVCGQYAYALEQFTNAGVAQFSARANAPADEVTHYDWISAWVNVDSWPEAVMAAQELDRRIRRAESFGEHRLVRRSEP